MAETFQICESCRQKVQQGEPGVLRAVELINADTLTERGEIEGLGVFFHVGCWGSGIPGFRLKAD